MPGNVGDDRTITTTLAALGLDQPVGGRDQRTIVTLEQGRSTTSPSPFTTATWSMRYYIDTLGLELIGDEIAGDPGVRLVYLAAGADKVQLVQPLRPGPVAT